MRNLFQFLLISIYICFMCCQDFNFKESLNYLVYSKASSCEKDKIQQWNCGQICKFHKDMSDVQVLNNKSVNTQGFIGYNNGKIIIAFRGTEGFINVVMDIVFKKVKYKICKDCKVHYGFLQAFQSLKDDMIKHLEILMQKYKNAQIVLTGHSLGGAIATIAALDINEFLQNNKNKYPNKIITVYTFGSPRVGNKQFSDFYNKQIPNTYRIVNGHDTVVHYPTADSGFTHVGTEFWIDENQKIKRKCQKLAEDKNCSMKLKFKDFLNKDHSNYLKNKTGCKYPDLKINK